MIRLRPAASVLSVTALLIAASYGCSADNNKDGGGAANSGGNNSGGSTAQNGTLHGATGTASGTFTTGTSDTGAFMVGAGGSPPVCTGLECDIHSCTGAQAATGTQITGTIYDPAGKNPLYGAVAYVPNTKPADFTPGSSCYSCGDLYTGDPIAAAVTVSNGVFTINKAPDGDNIPLVIQVGKWRRQFVLPKVNLCGNTQVPDLTLTLPKNGTEGDIPQMAISTGSSDTLECLLERIGLDEAEYTPGPGGTGHLHVFQGNQGAPNTNPKAPDPSKTLWDSDADINLYDIVLLSCEGKETENMDQQVLFDYAKGGGRVFASHYHYAWFNTGPFQSANLATWTPGSNDMGDINSTVVTTTWTNQPFDRGQSMHDWLKNVGALTNDELPIQEARHNSDVAVTNTPSQRWLIADNKSSNPGTSQDFTFDTPIGAAAASQCGRVAFSDMHVGAASADYKGAGGTTTPKGCTVADLSPQEKALEFIFFDLSSCVTPNNMTQPPPGQPPS